MVCEFPDGWVVVVDKGEQLPDKGGLCACIQRLSLGHIVGLLLFCLIRHAVLLLAHYDLQRVLLLDDLADHDEGGGNEVGLCCQAKLEHSLQEGQNSVNVLILLYGNQYEVKE